MLRSGFCLASEPHAHLGGGCVRARSPLARGSVENAASQGLVRTSPKFAERMQKALLFLRVILPVCGSGKPKSHSQVPARWTCAVTGDEGASSSKIDATRRTRLYSDLDSGIESVNSFPASCTDRK